MVSHGFGDPPFQESPISNGYQWLNKVCQLTMTSESFAHGGFIRSIRMSWTSWQRRIPFLNGTRIIDWKRVKTGLSIARSNH